MGLSPDEVPIIAQKGEEMLTRDDPRHMLNGGGASEGKSSDGGTTIINTFDPEEVMDRALRFAPLKVLVERDPGLPGQRSGGPWITLTRNASRLCQPRADWFQAERLG